MTRLKIARVCEQGVPDGEEEFSREEECERQSAQEKKEREGGEIIHNIIIYVK